MGANKTATLSLAARLPSKQLITVKSKQNSDANRGLTVVFLGKTSTATLSLAARLPSKQLITVGRRRSRPPPAEIVFV
jgi:hypothetical protein